MRAEFLIEIADWTVSAQVCETWTAANLRLLADFLDATPEWQLRHINKNRRPRAVPKV